MHFVNIKSFNAILHVGCEFFREYKDKNYNPVDLHFDWTQVQLYTVASSHMDGSIVNPQRACAVRITVLGLYVCVCVCVRLSVCLSVSSKLASCAITCQQEILTASA